jgi:hypothetical protein
VGSMDRRPDVLPDAGSKLIDIGRGRPNSRVTRVHLGVQAISNGNTGKGIPSFADSVNHWRQADIQAVAVSPASFRYPLAGSWLRTRPSCRR